jgi:hypothetical protein
MDRGSNLALSVFLRMGHLRSRASCAPDAGDQSGIIVVYGRDVNAVTMSNLLGPLFLVSVASVDAGFVQSFAHPGGNFTGVSLMSLVSVESASSY